MGHERRAVHRNDEPRWTCREVQRFDATKDEYIAPEASARRPAPNHRHVDPAYDDVKTLDDQFNTGLVRYPNRPIVQPLPADNDQYPDDGQDRRHRDRQKHHDKNKDAFA
jgi:hypothetical protein